MDATYVHYKNETNSMSINDDANVFCNYYASFLSSNNQEYVLTGGKNELKTNFHHRNTILDLLLNKYKSF